VISPDRQRRDLAILTAAALLFILVSFGVEYRQLHTLNPTLDDTFIHLRFAWNLAHGQGLSFNPGQPMPGSTSPLWVILLTPAAAVLNQDHLVIFALALSALAYLAAGLMAWRLARELDLPAPFDLLAGLMVLTNGRILWAGLSGMETDLLAALTLAACTLYLRGIKTGRFTAGAAILFGLATAGRPEGHMLFAGAVIHFLIGRRARRSEAPDISPWHRGLLLPLIIYVALIAPYIIFSLATIGSPFPSTFLAKRAEFGRTRLDYISYTLLYFVLDNPVAAVLFLPALGAIIHQTWKRPLDFLSSPDGLVAGWGLGYLVVSTALTPMPFHFCRYQIPVIPFLLLPVIRLVVNAAGWGETRRPGLHRRLALAGFFLLLLPQLVALSRWPGLTTLCAKNILDMHVNIGRMLHRIAPPGARVATMDIGAIGYYADREIVDLVGLVTPAVVPYVRGKGFTHDRSESLLLFLRQVQPEFIAVFPAAYPGLLDDRRVFVPLGEVRLPDNKIAEADWMVVCQCLWYKAPAAAPDPEKSRAP
jgi:arabinofuranosyltransferase